MVVLDITSLCHHYCTHAAIKLYQLCILVFLYSILVIVMEV